MMSEKRTPDGNGVTPAAVAPAAPTAGRGGAWPALALLVPHPRIAAVARELGCREVIETAPGDEGLIAGLLQLFAVK